MLHKCDAGEYSVLTVYPPEYDYQEEGIWRSERMRFMEETKVSAMIIARFFENGYPAYQPFNIDRNVDKLIKPFKGSSFAGGFNFSFGHYISNVGYDSQFDHVWTWEETYQFYMSWKAGYTLYVPNEFI